MLPRNLPLSDHSFISSSVRYLLLSPYLVPELHAAVAYVGCEAPPQPCVEEAQAEGRAEDGVRGQLHLAHDALQEIRVPSGCSVIAGG